MILNWNFVRVDSQKAFAINRWRCLPADRWRWIILFSKQSRKHGTERQVIVLFLDLNVFSWLNSSEIIS